MANIVLQTPGWHESSKVCAQWITCGCKSTGTNNRFYGRSIGGRAPPLACLTSFSICQVTVSTTQVIGRIGSGSLASGSEAKSWDRASGLIVGGECIPRRGASFHPAPSVERGLRLPQSRTDAAGLAW